MTNCHQLKMLVADGKQRPTDAATAQTLLRLVQPAPSPKAEPISTGWRRSACRKWPIQACRSIRQRDLAKATAQREMDSAGMTGQETRNKLTDYCADHDIKKGEEFAIAFKQIIGRGTRLYDGKDYFTIYDFVMAHHPFSDLEWDGAFRARSLQEMRTASVYLRKAGTSALRCMRGNGLQRQEGSPDLRGSYSKR